MFLVILLFSIIYRWMPYILVAESLLLIFAQRTLFRDLRTQSTFIRLYDFVHAILAPKESESSSHVVPKGNLLDQRQLMHNYIYFLSEIKNSFERKQRCVRDSSIVLVLNVGFIIYNVAALHIFDKASR